MKINTSNFIQKASKKITKLFALVFFGVLFFQTSQAQNTIEMAEATVKPNDPNYILKKAIERIPQNYATEAINMNGFYRETIQQDEKFVQLTEAVCDFYYTPYNESLNLKKAYQSYYKNTEYLVSNTFVEGRWFDELTHANDQAKIVEIRANDAKFENQLQTSISGGPAGLLAYDKVKYNTYFMSVGQNKVFHKVYKNYEDDYNYQLDDIANMNGQEIYIISFAPKKKTNENLFEGEIWIEKESMAIISMVYSAVNQDENYQFNANQVKHIKHTVKVDYQNQNGKWFLNQIQVNDQVSILDKKTKQTLATFTTGSELKINQIKTENVVKFNDDEVFVNALNNHLYEKTNDYNEAFWNNFENTDGFVAMKESIKTNFERNGNLKTQFATKKNIVNQDNVSVRGAKNHK